MTPAEAGRAHERRLVVSPAVAFSSLEPPLTSLGWQPQPVTTVTAPIVPGEPELKQWRRLDDDALLTYTFNPVVNLRTLHISGAAADAHARAIAAAVPTVSAADLETAFASPDPRELLRGILTAGEMEATDAAGRIGLLAAHRDPAVAEAAARVHLSLLHTSATALAATDRTEDLAFVLQAICGNAVPLLTALPMASPDELLGLQPSEEDCRAALVDGPAGLDLPARVASVYDSIFATPGGIDPGSDRRELRVRACPAALFASDNPFSYAFPAGYRRVAPYLRHGRVWLAWRYCAPGSESGFALDGLVHVRGNWVWFPKVYDAVYDAIRSRPGWSETP